MLKRTCFYGLILVACTFSPNAPEPPWEPGVEVIQLGDETFYCEPLKMPERPALHFPADITVTQDGQKVYALNGECLGYTFPYVTVGVPRETGCEEPLSNKIYKRVESEPSEAGYVTVEVIIEHRLLEGTPAYKMPDSMRRYIYEVQANSDAPQILTPQGRPSLSCVLGSYLEIDAQDNLYVLGSERRIHRIKDRESLQMIPVEIQEKVPSLSLYTPDSDGETLLIAPILMFMSENMLYYTGYAHGDAGSSYHRIGGINVQTDVPVKNQDYLGGTSPENLMTYLNPHFYTGFLPQIFYPERMNRNYWPAPPEPAYIALSGPVESLQQQVGEIGEVHNVAARSETDRNLFYYSDSSRHVIYRVIASKDHELLDFSIFAGSPAQAGLVDGTGSAARFYAPSGLSLDAAGNLFVSDTANHAIRKITPAGEVSTFYRETQPYVPRFADKP